MPDPLFTLTEEKQTWKVQDEHHIIFLTHYASGKIDVRTNTGKDTFMFIESDPNMVLAIGRLLIAVARKAGATDA